MTALCDEDATGSDEPARSGAGGFHQRLPLRRVVCVIRVRGRGDVTRGFGGADGLVAATLRQEVEDGLLEQLTLSRGLVGATAV